MNSEHTAAPRVYAAIASVTAQLARDGIPKSRRNDTDNYAFRSIDDVLNRLAPILARHRLCILPRVLERTCEERQGENDTMLMSVCLRIAFDIVSARDGSMHTIEGFGEALDTGDKATAKAMSAAYKHLVLQAFCIPVRGVEDPDATSLRLSSGNDQQDPAQGWEQWSLDILELIAGSETTDAVDRIQQAYRIMLRAASKRRPDVYSAIGEAMRERRAALALGGSSIAAHRRRGNCAVTGEVIAHA